MPTQGEPPEFWIDHAASIEVREDVACWEYDVDGQRSIFKADPAILLESILRGWNAYKAYVGGHPSGRRAKRRLPKRLH